ncbi:MAG: hypothetical protein QOD77_1514 [Thermoplasmata archaeon]|nr:hypothetical protein [Thermoplasmata archaeon]
MPDPLFFDAYRRGNPPWDIGRAQPAFVELAQAGEIKGSVLDVGCGTGDLVLEMAERGHDAWGVDVVPMAIDQAKAKSQLRDVEAVFLVGDALELEHLNRSFDTVLDCGLFHIFSDPERILYARQLAKVVAPGGVLHLMAMSDWEDPGWGGPRRISQAEILEIFSTGWRFEDIREARFATTLQRVRGHAWLATLVREEPKKGRKKAKKLPPQTEEHPAKPPKASKPKAKRTIEEHPHSR